MFQMHASSHSHEGGSYEGGSHLWDLPSCECEDACIRNTLFFVSLVGDKVLCQVFVLVQQIV